MRFGIVGCVQYFGNDEGSIQRIHVYVLLNLFYINEIREINPTWVFIASDQKLRKKAFNDTGRTETAIFVRKSYKEVIQ